ncbi:MAG: sigma-70 family RNA polymerase sigma factor [Acidobacteria bacterium]|nr:sigma-70 family RNA polymerase sigma factor [Acidobacteriota bacterium]
MSRDDQLELLKTLAERMKQREEEAFQQFADIFAPRFRSFFRKQGISAGYADDLAVSCVTDIALKVDKYESKEKSTFEAWVFTLVWNALADWFRREKGSDPLSETLAIEEREEGSPPDPQMILVIRAAIQELSAIDQQIIALKYERNEITFAEIGKIIGLTEINARVRHNRILKRLERKFRDDPRLTRFIQRATRKE